MPRKSFRRRPIDAAVRLRDDQLTELLADREDRDALSPKILFVLDVEILRPLLQGLANDYPKFIRVNFNKDIQENIFLNADKTPDDVIQLF